MREVLDVSDLDLVFAVVDGADLACAVVCNDVALEGLVIDNVAAHTDHEDIVASAAGEGGCFIFVGIGFNALAGD